MIYQLLRFPLVTLYFFFYRRIYVTGRHNIPKDAPTLVASNHSTAFMEQILVAGLQWRSVYFWASGAVLEKNSAFASIFRQSHVIPIWKQEEGVKNLHKNKQIFEDSKNILLEGKMFFIAPEGNSVAEKRLRKFKTGTARLALLTAAANNFEKDVFILPTGVNYTYHFNFRSEVMISFGQPINVKTYKALYEENPKNTVRKLTEDLKKAVGEEAILIDSKDDETLVEQLHILLRNEYQHYNDPRYSSNENRLKLEQEVAKTCNNLAEQQKTNLKQQANSYFHQLKEQQLADKAVEQKGSFHLGQFLKASLLSPVALLGWIGGALPVTSARYFRNKSIKNRQFLAPMTLVFSFVTWLIYSLIISLIGAFFVGWAALAIPPVLILLQYIAFENKEDWKAILDNKKYRNWKKKNSHTAQNLETERKNLVLNFQNISVKKSKACIEQASLELMD